MSPTQALNHATQQTPAHRTQLVADADLQSTGFMALPTLLYTLNIATVTVLSGAQYSQFFEALESYFDTPRQWPRHHAQQDERALRHACGGPVFSAH